MLQQCLNTVVSSFPGNHHYQFLNICSVDHSTFSLQPLVEIPTLQQVGECQDPLVGWTELFQECQVVKEEFLGKVGGEMEKDSWMRE